MSEKLQSVVSELREKTANFDATGKEFLAIQISLKDLDESFFIEIKDDVLTIEPSEYADRQAKVIMTSDDFIKMMNGQLNSMIALTTGKLKVEGDLMKASALSKIFKK